MSSPLVIPVAHDFICPWCWAGLFHVKRLKAEFGVEFDWRGHELIPEEMEWPQRRPADPEPPNKPPVLSRFEFLKLMDGIEVPQVEKPRQMRDHAAFEAVEFMKEHSPASVDLFVEDVYRAYWERGERIGDIDVLERLAAPYVTVGLALREALEEKRYRDKIIPFDAPSYKAGVFHVPTFFIGDKRYAEQPYMVLQKAMREFLGWNESDAIYRSIAFPAAPSNRPYIYINMVATIDGKIILGERDEPVVDLGSSTDHELMKRIEAASDAVLLGAQTLRAAKKSWNPNTNVRVVVSKSGNLPFDSCFFTGRVIVAGPGEAKRPESVEALPFSDLDGLMGSLRKMGIEKLLVLGGSTLNSELFERGLIDEIFLTLAPKIKLGEDTPTIADGNPLPHESIQNYSFVERHLVGDELFLRYRRQI